MHGRAKYRATGHGFVVRHEKFAENERMYSRSHFTKGLELMMLLIIYHLYGSTVSGSTAYILLTGSMWFLVISWLFASFIFNSSGFEWQKIVEDWDAFSKWISSHGGVVLVCQQPRAGNRGGLKNKSTCNTQNWMENSRRLFFLRGSFYIRTEYFII